MGLTRLSRRDAGEHSPSFLPIFNSAWGQTAVTGACSVGAPLCLQEMFLSAIRHPVTQPAVWQKEQQQRLARWGARQRLGAIELSRPEISVGSLRCNVVFNLSWGERGGTKHGAPQEWKHQLIPWFRSCVSAVPRGASSAPHQQSAYIKASLTIVKSKTFWL